jgi:hypothetical protein
MKRILPVFASVSMLLALSSSAAEQVTIRYKPDLLKDSASWQNMLWILTRELRIHGSDGDCVIPSVIQMAYPQEGVSEGVKNTLEIRIEGRGDWSGCEQAAKEHSKDFLQIPGVVIVEQRTISK